MLPASILEGNGKAGRPRVQCPKCGSERVGGCVSVQWQQWETALLLQGMRSEVFYEFGVVSPFFLLWKDEVVFADFLHWVEVGIPGGKALIV